MTLAFGVFFATLFFFFFFFFTKNQRYFCLDLIRIVVSYTITMQTYMYREIKAKKKKCAQ